MKKILFEIFYFMTDNIDKIMFGFIIIGILAFISIYTFIGINNYYGETYEDNITIEVEVLYKYKKNGDFYISGLYKENKCIEIKLDNEHEYNWFKEGNKIYVDKVYLMYKYNNKLIKTYYRIHKI